MTTLTVTPNGAGVALRLTELAAKLEAGRAANELGDLLKRRILARTARGEDVDGQPFAPYAASYAKRRHRHGRESRVVTLRYTGEMLDSLALQPAAGGVNLGFASGAMAARAAHNQRRRPFMGANADDLAALRTALKTMLTTGKE